MAVIVAVSPLITKAQDKSPTNQTYIKELIKEFKFKYPDLVFHIYAKESGFGSSRLALEDSNLFGMKYPTKRYSRAIYKTPSGFAGYKSVKDCVLDLKLYELRYLQNKNRQQYKQYLKDVYSLDVNYFEKFVGK